MPDTRRGLYFAACRSSFAQPRCKASIRLGKFDNRLIPRHLLNQQSLAVYNRRRRGTGKGLHENTPGSDKGPRGRGGHRRVSLASSIAAGRHSERDAGAAQGDVRPACASAVVLSEPGAAGAAPAGGVAPSSAAVGQSTTAPKAGTGASISSAIRLRSLSIHLGRTLCICNGWAITLCPSVN